MPVFMEKIAVGFRGDVWLHLADDAHGIVATAFL